MPAIPLILNFDVLCHALIQWRDTHSENVLLSTVDLDMESRGTFQVGRESERQIMMSSWSRTNRDSEQE